MKLLVIGGTKFLGRYVVETARARGDEVTTFNRGKTNPTLFPDVEHLTGDRDGGLEVLAHRSWDAVIDTCGYAPRVVDQSARLLAGRVGIYAFVSSVSVYADFKQRGITEDQPLASLDPAFTEETAPANYGAQKARCEQSVRAHFPANALIVRPGIIVGPHDPTDRFTYWVHRIGTESRVVVPASDRSAFQFIYARDLADWILSMVADGRQGTFNATGPEEPLSMKSFFELCRDSLNPNAELRWASESILAEHGLPDWNQMPLWVPGSEPDMIGFFTVNCKRAAAAGLAFTSTQDVVSRTFEWIRAQPVPYPWKLGMPRNKEADLAVALRPKP